MFKCLSAAKDGVSPEYFFLVISLEVSFHAIFLHKNYFSCVGSSEKLCGFK